MTSSEFHLNDKSLDNPPSYTIKSTSEQSSSPVRVLDAQKRNMETLAKGVDYHPPSAEKLS